MVNNGFDWDINIRDIMKKAIVNYRIEPLEALNQLPPRLKQVIEMRLGVGQWNRSYTFKEIGAIMENIANPGHSLSNERIRQMEAKALRFLRHPMRNCNIL